MKRVLGVLIVTCIMFASVGFVHASGKGLLGFNAQQTARPPVTVIKKFISSQDLVLDKQMYETTRAGEIKLTPEGFQSLSEKFGPTNPAGAAGDGACMCYQSCEDGPPPRCTPCVCDPAGCGSC